MKDSYLFPRLYVTKTWDQRHTTVAARGMQPCWLFCFHRLRGWWAYLPIIIWYATKVHSRATER